MNKLKEGMGFREFKRSADVGGSGYYYDYGSSPSKNNSKKMAEEDFEKWTVQQIEEPKGPTVDEMLSHINALSKAAMAKCESLSKTDKESPYIIRQLEKAKSNLREAYLRLMDMNR